MARKLILKLDNLLTDKAAKIYRDAEWNEYRTTFYADGVKLPGSDGVTADHHTDSKADAIYTACAYVWPQSATPSAREAVAAWQEHHGKKWRDALALAWMNGNYGRFHDYATLQWLRNTCGPSWLAALPNPDAE